MEVSNKTIFSVFLLEKLKFFGSSTLINFLHSAVNNPSVFHPTSLVVFWEIVSLCAVQLNSENVRMLSIVEDTIFINH